ncbi:MAG: winged helix DNA-binding domain-containing protein [Actinobacteria bacterium]|nr:winged helix DNA-binding domain-containing protein [Actinomycetota bacterium]
MTAASHVLGRRALNRALLERQMLLRRRRVPVLDAVEHLVAMQAQVPRDPYVALWSRLDRFRPESLAEPIAEHRAVRMTPLRGTLHLVTARDALALRPLMQRVVERTLYGSSPLRTAVGSFDVDELLTLFRELFDERPRTRAEIVEVIRERWPDRDATSLGYAMYLLPTVQVTPRGLWRKSGPSAFTTVENWLGRSMETDPQPDEMLSRYLTAFGPATVADAQNWSGLSGLKEVFERLRPGLRTFCDEQGRELYDVPGAPLPNPDVPAPARFLPEYDNVGLGHADRARIVAPQMRGWGEVGWGSVLVDGFGSARWKLDLEDGEATLRIEPYVKLARTDRAAIAAEGERLVRFLAAEAGTYDIRFAPTT